GSQLHQRTAIESRQGESARRSADVLRRPELLLPRSLSARAGRDRGRHQARGEQVSHQRPHRVEQRASWKNGARVACEQEHGRDGSTHGQDGDDAMSNLKWLSALLVAGAATAAVAQTPKLDRRVIPTAGKTPELHVPSWTKTTLPDGAELVVSEKHNLPL